MSKNECCYLCNECPASFASLDNLEAHLQIGVHSSGVSAAMMATTAASTVAVNLTPEPRRTDNCTMISSMSPTSSSSTLLDSPFKMDQSGAVGKEEFPCNLCARKFSDRDQLNTHQVHTHRQKPNYVCEICNAAFGIKRDKQTHMRIHSGEMPQKCNECGKQFGTRQLLKKHQMWHTGKRTHVCGQCGKSFFQRGHLSQHYQIHKNVRPFACLLCEKTFIFKFDLNRHMKIHAERGYCCTKCGKSFARQSLLDEHSCKKLSPKKTNTKSVGSPVSDFSQIETVVANSPSTTGQQSPNSLNLMAPLSPEEAKKDSQTVNEPIGQVGIARMAQILLAQHQQRMFNAAAQNFLVQQQATTTNPIQPPAANPVTLANLTPVQLSLLLQQYRQTIQSAYYCSICAISFDSQANYILHCSRAHFNNSGMIPSPTTVEQILSPSELQTTTLDNKVISQPKEEQYESATTSSCASSPQKVSPITAGHQLITADWLSAAGALPSCLRNHSSSPPCDRCVEYQSKYVELKKNYSQTRSELDRLKELMGQLGSFTNLLSWQRAT